jgi:glucose/mannose-6-phosphate isomerase
MIDLNNLDEIKKLDPKDVYGSTGMFFKQCMQVWTEGKIVFPSEYKVIDNIIVCGMGGSAYGGYVAQTLFKDALAVPIYSNNDYHLPAFANNRSLIILSSYSGSTEESLSCGEEAYEKRFPVIGITAGGKLAELLTSHNSPFLHFNPINNPSGQPRLGTGYMVLGFISLLVNLGFIKYTDEEVMQAVKEVEEQVEQMKAVAQEVAKQLQGKIPALFAAEHLVGNVHILRNQLNETAKTFSAFEDIPELNHHLMEGLKNPQDNKLAVLFVNSDMYSDKIKKRMELTKDVVAKNNVSVLNYNPAGTTKLAQSLSVLSFGGYLSLYLALLYGQDPSLIPWVDYFKEQLSK